MTAASRRRGVFTGVAVALILPLAGPAAAREHNCVRQVTGDFLFRMERGAEALAEFRAYGTSVGRDDLLATLDSMGRCVPCTHNWLARPVGDDQFESTFVVSCEMDRLYVRLVIEDPGVGCKLREIEHSSNSDLVIRHLRQRDIDPEDCVWPPVARDPIRVEGAVKAPVRVTAPRPTYTPQARAARIQGVVILRATIDKRGNVIDIEVLKGVPMGLTEMAVSTVRKWKFKPATLNGEPVAVYHNLTINFALK